MSTSDDPPTALRRKTFLAVAGLGAMLGVIAWAGGREEMAIFSVVLLTAFGAVVAFTDWEWSVIQGPTADERQRSINTRATELAYFAVVFAAGIGFCVELYRNDPGPFTLIGLIGGFTHMTAILFLRRRS